MINGGGGGSFLEGRRSFLEGRRLAAGPSGAGWICAEGGVVGVRCLLDLRDIRDVVASRAREARMSRIA